MRSITKAHSVKEIARNTYEIGEFDCASMYLIVGNKKALLIDTGIGIGDLKGVVQRITDKPITLLLTHSHEDHIGGMGFFKQAMLNRADWFTMFNLVPSVEGRKRYAKFIKNRTGLAYEYDPETDIIQWPAIPRILPITDEQQFELGGRIVTAYECPGHTAGSMVFIDDQSNILFAGDACNCNLLMSSKPGTLAFVSIERALKALKRIGSMSNRFNSIYNGHYDFRSFGEPLEASVFQDAINCCEMLVDGNYKAEKIDGMFPGAPERTVMRYGNVMLTFCEEGIHEL